MDGRQDGECFYQVLQQTRRWHLVHLSSLDILDHFYFPIYFNACPQNVFVACFAVVCKSKTLLVSGAELIPAEAGRGAATTGHCHRPLCRIIPSYGTSVDQHYWPLFTYWNIWNIEICAGPGPGSRQWCCALLLCHWTWNSASCSRHPPAILGRACIQFPRFEKCETAANQIWSGLKALNQHNHFS